jgi:predicted PurR-regulated permease PerM
MNSLILQLPFTLLKRCLIKLTFKKVLFFSFFLLLICLIFYIFQITFVTQYTFLIKDYQKKITVLSQENLNLEIALAKEDSLLRIDKLVENLKFEKIGQIHYFQLREEQVAAK